MRIAGLGRGKLRVEHLCQLTFRVTLGHAGLPRLPEGEDQRLPTRHFRVFGAFKLMTQELAGGAPQALTDTQHDESPSFAPNGRQIVYESLGKLWVKPAGSGGAARRLTRSDDTSFEAYPLEATDIARALRHFPEAQAVAGPFLAAWDSGKRRFALANGFDEVFNSSEGGLPDRVPVCLENFMHACKVAGVSLQDYCVSGEVMA